MLTDLVYVLGVRSVVFIGLLCLLIWCMYWMLTVLCLEVCCAYRSGVCIGC